MISSRLTRVALALALLAAAFALTDLRRAFIRVLVTRDAAPIERPVAPLPDTGAGGPLTAVPRVRVLLIDGLGLEQARKLPTLNALCAGGEDLVIDVGFPTVSLPVQVALWSGLTQQQTGIVFRSGRQLEHPLAVGIAASVADSMAVAESHPYIIRSLGFAQTQPTGEDPVKPPANWSEGGFAAASLAAVASARALVLIHSVAIDSAGHRHGTNSEAYRGAAFAADALLAKLLEASDAGPSATTRWFVLADHGHLPGGGHGDAEPALRLVRACIAGGSGLSPGRTGQLTLIDLSLAIADSLGVTLPETSYARPYLAALEAPATGATLPRPGGLSLAAAGLLLLFAISLTLVAGQGKATRFPYWWAVAFVSLLLIEGGASMSTPMTYTPKGRTILVASLPGFLWLAVHLAWLIRKQGLWRALLGQLAIPTAGLIGALTLADGLGLLVGGGEPAAMPWWTAQVSVMALYLAAGFAVAGLAALATAVPFAFGPSKPPGTPPAPV